MRDTYHVMAAEAWLYGRLRRAGDEVQLTAAEAEYPLRRGVIAHGSAPKSLSKGARRRNRSERDADASRPVAGSDVAHGPTVTDAE